MRAIDKIRNSESLWVYVLVTITLVIGLGLGIHTLINRGEQARQPIEEVVSLPADQSEETPSEERAPAGRTDNSSRPGSNDSNQDLPATGLSSATYSALVIGLITFVTVKYAQSLRFVRDL